MIDPRPSAPHSVQRLLEAGVAAGIISPEQQRALAALADGVEGAAANEAAAGERPRGFNAVTVAYGLGALLVVFSCGWFLVDRWARLGAWGVLLVVLAYVAILALAARWLVQHRYAVAAQVCVALAVGMSALVAWALLSLAGRWPDPASSHPLLRDRAWMAWQWLIVALSVLLAALLVLRRWATPAVTWPAAVALWGVWLQLSRILHDVDGPASYDRFIFLANGLVLLLIADVVERWQRRRVPGDAAAGGDFAGAFWAAGLLASAVAYLSIWGRADDGWRHLLLPFALGLVALSLYLRRRLVLLVGVAGVIGYLGFLAEDVFREYLSFPILLAALGVLVILVTVWTQARFPALVARIDASRASAERPLPWSVPMAALPLVVAVALALIALGDAAEERAQADFRQRWYILRLHSGSIAPDAPRRRGPRVARPDSTASSPAPPPADARPRGTAKPSP